MRVKDGVGDVTVQRVQVDDLPQILSLAASCPEAPAWPADAWHSFVLPEESGSAIQRVLFAIRSPEGSFTGLIAVTLMERTTELELLLVQPQSRRLGVARLLIRHWFEWARQADVTEAVLEVRASNAAAQNLYRSFGFTDGGWRARYYHHPAEDALLMRKGFEL